jgi:uncharacterized protein YjbJ (UPF0337 family)
MKASTKDKAEGTFHEVKGRTKEEIGTLTKDAHLKAEGQVEKATGKAQKWIGRAEKKIGA